MQGINNNHKCLMVPSGPWADSSDLQTSDGYKHLLYVCMYIQN